MTQVPLYVDNKSTFYNNFSIKINPLDYYTEKENPQGYYGLYGKPFDRVFKFKENEEKYYYSVVFSFSCFSNIAENIIIPDSVVLDINKKQAKVLLVCPYEGWSWKYWENLINNICKKYQFDNDRFVVLDGNLQPHSEIKSIYFNFWERGLIYQNLPSLQINGTDKILFNPARENRYIYLNRRPHVGRIAAVTLMEKHKDKGYLSLGLNGQMHPDYYENQEKTLANMYPKINKKYHKNRLKERLPFTINDGINAEEDNPVDDKQVYKFYDSFLHIVAETYQINETDRMFFSEKIFKPIMFMQPFVLLGQTHSLKNLQQLGYKTFSNFFDESYDEIQNEEKRLKRAISTIEEVISRSDKELEKLMVDCLPILTHNISHLQYRCMTYDINIKDQLLKVLYE